MKLHTPYPILRAVLVIAVGAAILIVPRILSHAHFRVSTAHAQNVVPADTRIELPPMW